MAKTRDVTISVDDTTLQVDSSNEEKGDDLSVSNEGSSKSADESGNNDSSVSSSKPTEESSNDNGNQIQTKPIEPSQQTETVKVKKPRKPRKKKTVENTDNVETVVEEKPAVVITEDKEEKPVTKNDNSWLWALVGLIAVIVAVMIFKIVKENSNG